MMIRTVISSNGQNTSSSNHKHSKDVFVPLLKVLSRVIRQEKNITDADWIGRSNMVLICD